MNVLSQETCREFKYQAQFQVADNGKPGPNPSTDCALLLLVGSSQLVPTVMYEYKPTVHSDKMRVDSIALLEMLLQAHYCMRFYNTTVVLHCLTDLRTWFYFKTTLNSGGKLNVRWWHQFESAAETEEELVEHSKFIVSEVSCILG